MYSEKVMDHFEHPRNVGEIENASGVGTVGNAKCGDIMRIYLDIDDNQIIRDVKFKTFGCGAAVATQLYGIMQKSMISRLKDSRNRSLIFTKVKRRKKKNIKPENFIWKRKKL